VEEVPRQGVYDHPNKWRKTMISETLMLLVCWTSVGINLFISDPSYSSYTPSTLPPENKADDGTGSWERGEENEGLGKRL
jgi:hypothetical protein